MNIFIEKSTPLTSGNEPRIANISTYSSKMGPAKKSPLDIEHKDRSLFQRKDKTKYSYVQLRTFRKHIGDN